MKSINIQIKSYIIIIVSVLLLFSILSGVYTLLKPSYSVAFMQSSEVLQKYAGFREAQGYIENRAQIAKSRIDSTYNIYVTLLEDFNKNENRYSASEKQLKKQEIEHSKNNYEQLQEKIETEISGENDKILQGALNQVNSYVKEYAVANGIDLVIGVTMSGNVMYGSEQIDITEEIIEGLNKQFKK